MGRDVLLQQWEGRAAGLHGRGLESTVLLGNLALDLDKR